MSLDFMDLRGESLSLGSFELGAVLAPCEDSLGDLLDR